MAGTIGIQTPLAVMFTQSSAGAAANNYTMLRGGTVVDAVCVARATQMSGTVTVGNGASAITDTAIVAATDTNVTRATTIDDANYVLAAGDSLRFTTVGAATLVTCVAWIIPPVADSTTIA